MTSIAVTTGGTSWNSRKSEGQKILTQAISATMPETNNEGTCKVVSVRTRRHKVAGSIPESVIGIFHWHNPSGRSVALEWTQPLTETSTRNISWGAKVADA
jgi:hypothetical protein